MTHDELKIAITRQISVAPPFALGGFTQFLLGLFRVVQLHKPEQRCYDATCYCKDMCSKCKEDYPCSTIQEIEKELS